jgi:hypothetical protein
MSIVLAMLYNKDSRSTNQNRCVSPLAKRFHMIILVKVRRNRRKRMRQIFIQARAKKFWRRINNAIGRMNSGSSNSTSAKKEARKRIIFVRPSNLWITVSMSR